MQMNLKCLSVISGVCRVSQGLRINNLIAMLRQRIINNTLFPNTAVRKDVFKQKILPAYL